MNKKIQRKRDDEHHRLLLALIKATGILFYQLVNIRKGVWLAIAPKEYWIVKQFSNDRTIQLQIQLTEQLRSRGFSNTYVFHPIHQGGPMIVEDKILGILTYIAPSKNEKFHYGTERNRREALTLLTHFHEVTSDLIDLFHKQLKRFEQIQKWELRLAEFKSNVQRINWTIANRYFEQYVSAGEWALKKLKEDKQFFSKRPHVILHGDVAHHNFIRGQDGLLYLIDFDLMSIGPKVIDLLQYCNRILPSLDWSVNKLFTDERLQSFNVRPFLAALVYPSDLFREWNHFLKLNQKAQRKRWPFIRSITFEQFSKRMAFTKQLQMKVEKQRD